MKKKDIDKFKRGLTDAQKEEWLKLYRAALKEALAEGLEELDAEVKAIKKANAFFSDTKLSNEFSNPLHRLKDDNPLNLIFSEASEEDDYQLVLPIGLTYSNWYGEIIITKKYCEALIANQGALKNTKPFLDTDHDRAESNGWLMDMRVTDEGLEVKWDFTDRGRDLLQRKIYRYYSATLYTVMDIETGNYIWPVLVGAALTNSPVMKQLPEAHLADTDQASGQKDTFSTHGDGATQRKGANMNFAELLAAAMALSAEDRKKLFAALEVKDQTKEVQVLSETNTELTKQVTELTAENKALKETAKETAVTDTLNKALSEGKIKPADKEDWNKKLSDNYEVFSEVLKNLPANSAVNLSKPSGTDSSGTANIDPEAEKILLSQGFSEEDLKKYGGDQ